MSSAKGSEVEVDLPLIDLSVLPSALEQDHPEVQRLSNKIREACQQWGFFRVINHGVAQNIVQRVDSVARDLFVLPIAVKEKAIFSTYFDGYTGRSDTFPYRESISFSKLLISDSTHRISDALWPQGNQEFCDAVQEYGYKMGELTNRLIKLVVISLGLDMPKHYKSIFSKCEGHLRMNFYSPSNSSMPLALRAHTDFSCLTILHQDQIGGLQVRARDGNWLNVKPLAGSFAVNIGDSFKIWSNCRYRSAEHRVLYGGWLSRLSLAFFLHFADEMEVCTPHELIDEEHPLRYKAFTFKEFREYKRQVIQNSDCPNKFLL